MHNLNSFTVDDVDCRPPHMWLPATVAVRPIMQLIHYQCICDEVIGFVDMCLDFSPDAYHWSYGDPTPRFATAGVP